MADPFERIADSFIAARNELADLPLFRKPKPPQKPPGFPFLQDQLSKLHIPLPPPPPPLPPLSQLGQLPPGTERARREEAERKARQARPPMRPSPPPPGRPMYPPGAVEGLAPVLRGIGDVARGFGQQIGAGFKAIRTGQEMELPEPRNMAEQVGRMLSMMYPRTATEIARTPAWQQALDALVMLPPATAIGPTLAQTRAAVQILRRSTIPEAEQVGRALLAGERGALGKGAGVGKVGKAAKGAPPVAKEPWQMTQGEITRKTTARLISEEEPQHMPTFDISAWAHSEVEGAETLKDAFVYKPTSATTYIKFTSYIRTAEAERRLAEISAFDEVYHRGIVKQALSEGKPVPPEVLADYPDLAARAKVMPQAVVPEAAPAPPVAVPTAPTFAIGRKSAEEIEQRAANSARVMRPLRPDQQKAFQEWALNEPNLAEADKAAIRIRTQELLGGKVEAAKAPAVAPVATYGQRLLLDLSVLDKRGASDFEYRSLLSTGTRTPLSKGETWRGRVERYARRDLERNPPLSAEVAKPPVVAPVAPAEVVKPPIAETAEAEWAAAKARVAARAGQPPPGQSPVGPPPPPGRVPPAQPPTPPVVPPPGAPPPVGPPAPIPGIPQGIVKMLTQAKAVVARDRPGVIVRMVDVVPGLKQLQRSLHPAVGMPEHITTAWVGQGHAQASVSNMLMANLVPTLRKLETAFGKGAISGEAKIVARFIGSAEEKMPFSGTLYDVLQRPELYDLSSAQKALLTEIQAQREAALNSLREAYGLDIGAFRVRPGGVFLGNVDKSEGALEMAGGLPSAVRRGAAKERFYETGADRWLHDKVAYPKNPERWFAPVTDVGQLMGLRGDETLANMAGQQVFKTGLGGKTKLEVLQETHPTLAKKMLALKKRLQSLRGTAGRLSEKQQAAIDDFMASPIEDVDLTDLRVGLEPLITRGPRKGMVPADVSKEIVGTRAQIAALQPAWRVANLKPYVFVTDGGLYRYFPVTEAQVVRRLAETSQSAALRALDDLRATAFGGDFSPATIQGLNAWFLDPVRTSKTLVEVGPGQLFSADALAADVRASPESWELFTRATGLNPLGGMGRTEFGVGFIGKLPRVGRLWQRFNDTVYRPTMWVMKKSFDGLVETGLKQGFTREQAAAVAGDDVTKLIPNYSYRRLGLSQAEAARYRAVLTSISFLTQPASFMTDATKGLVKLGARKTLTPSESFAVKRVLTLAALTETIAVTSNAFYAQSQGQDVEQAIKDSLNPGSGYFMSAVLPNGSRIGLGGPFRSLIRAVWPREIVGVPVPLPFAGIYNFSRSKLGPGVSVIYDEIRNRDYFGKQIRTGTFPLNILQGLEYALEGSMPLTAGTVAEQIRRGEPQSIVPQMVSQFGGVNLVPEDRVYMMKQRWADDLKAYSEIPSNPREAKAGYEIEGRRKTQTRQAFRKANPEVEAQLFITGQVDSLEKNQWGNYPARPIAVRLMRENGIGVKDIESLQEKPFESPDHKQLRQYFEGALGTPSQPTPKPQRLEGPTPTPMMPANGKFFTLEEMDKLYEQLQREKVGVK